MTYAAPHTHAWQSRWQAQLSGSWTWTGLPREAAVEALAATVTDLAGLASQAGPLLLRQLTQLMLQEGPSPNPWRWSIPVMGSSRVVRLTLAVTPSAVAEVGDTPGDLELLIDDPDLIFEPALTVDDLNPAAVAQALADAQARWPDESPFQLMTLVSAGVLLWQVGRALGVCETSLTVSGICYGDGQAVAILDSTLTVSEVAGRAGTVLAVDPARWRRTD